MIGTNNKAMIIMCLIQSVKYHLMLSSERVMRIQRLMK